MSFDVIKKPTVIFTIVLVIFGSGFELGSRFFAVKSSRGSLIRQGPIGLINPLLGCEIAPDQNEFTELNSIESNIKKLISGLINKKTVSDVSVYFRTLNSGRWVGIDEDAEFAPGSLLKVPVMTAYLKKQEHDPKTLAKEISYDSNEDRNLIENIKPSNYIIPGSVYTIADLLNYSIINSDNNAFYLLYQNLKGGEINKIYSDLKVPPPPDNSNTTEDNLDYLSAKVYFTFFRVFYNATYLNRTMSNKALDLLTKTEFEDGLVAGVPQGLKVAHKFGENSVVNVNADGSTSLNTAELHDCGIVYYPDHPYFICVMTKGTDFDKLKSAIKNISEVAYSQLDSYFKKSQ